MNAVAVANSAYIAAALLFIMSLAGLSKHETARTGVVYGIAGMAIAMTATIWLTFPASGTAQPAWGSSSWWQHC